MRFCNGFERFTCYDEKCLKIGRFGKGIADGMGVFEVNGICLGG